ncbi:hypothetical protein [Streptomyces sp. NPDC002537]
MSNEDGVVSLRISVGKSGGNPGVEDRVELVITREHAERIGRAMLAGGEQTVPCSVGVSFDSRPGERTPA